MDIDIDQNATNLSRPLKQVESSSLEIFPLVSVDEKAHFSKIPPPPLQPLLVSPYEYSPTNDPIFEQLTDILQTSNWLNHNLFDDSGPFGEFCIIFSKNEANLQSSKHPVTEYSLTFHLYIRALSFRRIDLIHYLFPIVSENIKTELFDLADIPFSSTKDPSTLTKTENFFLYSSFSMILNLFQDIMTRKVFAEIRNQSLEYFQPLLDFYLSVFPPSEAEPEPDSELGIIQIYQSNSNHKSQNNNPIIFHLFKLKDSQQNSFFHNFILLGLSNAVIWLSKTLLKYDASFFQLVFLFSLNRENMSPLHLSIQQSNILISEFISQNIPHSILELFFCNTTPTDTSVIEILDHTQPLDNTTMALSCKLAIDLLLESFALVPVIPLTIFLPFLNQDFLTNPSFDAISWFSRLYNSKLGEFSNQMYDSPDQLALIQHFHFSILSHFSNLFSTNFTNDQKPNDPSGLEKATTTLKSEYPNLSDFTMNLLHKTEDSQMKRVVILTQQLFDIFLPIHPNDIDSKFGQPAAVLLFEAIGSIFLKNPKLLLRLSNRLDIYFAIYLPFFFYSKESKIRLPISSTNILHKLPLFTISGINIAVNDSYDSRPEHLGNIFKRLAHRQGSEFLFCILFYHSQRLLKPILLKNVIIDTTNPRKANILHSLAVHGHHIAITLVLSSFFKIPTSRPSIPINRSTSKNIKTHKFEGNASIIETSMQGSTYMQGSAGSGPKYENLDLFMKRDVHGNTFGQLLFLFYRFDSIISIVSWLKDISFPTVSNFDDVVVDFSPEFLRIPHSENNKKQIMKSSGSNTSIRSSSSSNTTSFYNNPLYLFGTSLVSIDEISGNTLWHKMLLRQEEASTSQIQSIYRLILRYNIFPSNLKNKKQTNAFEAGLYTNNVEKVEILLQIASKLSLQSRRRVLNVLDSGVRAGKNQTLLHSAAWHNNHSLIVPLVEAGLDPTLIDSMNNSPLKYAVSHHHTQTVDALIQLFSKAKNISFVMLTDISHKQDREIKQEWKLFLKSFILTETFGKHQNSPLFHSISSRNIADPQLVQLLVRAGSELDYKNSENQNILHILSGQKDPSILAQILQIFINEGAQNLPISSGTTIQSFFQTLSIQTSNSGYTPFHSISSPQKDNAPGFSTFMAAFDLASQSENLLLSLIAHTAKGAPKSLQLLLDYLDQNSLMELIIKQFPNIPHEEFRQLFPSIGKKIMLDPVITAQNPLYPIHFCFLGYTHSIDCFFIFYTFLLEHFDDEIMIRMLLSRSPIGLINTHDFDVDTIFHTLVKSLNQEQLFNIIKTIPSPNIFFNSTTTFGNNILHFLMAHNDSLDNISCLAAIVECQKQVYSSLKECPAWNARNNDGKSPLDIGQEFGSKDLLDFISWHFR